MLDYDSLSLLFYSTKSAVSLRIHDIAQCAFEISKKQTDKKQLRGGPQGGESFPVVAMELSPRVYQRDFFRVGSMSWNWLEYIEAWEAVVPWWF